MNKVVLRQGGKVSMRCAALSKREESALQANPTRNRLFHLKAAAFSAGSLSCP